MPIRGPKYIVTPGDWQQVQIDLNDLWDSLTAAINVTTGGIVTDHNLLSGLQGGAIGEYYHLTATEHGSISNWNTAYSERLEWDGGSTNLVAATGRTSLGLGTAATHADTDFQAAATNLTSLAGLTFAATAFVKMTAAGTFGLDTTLYQPAGSTYLTGTLTAGRIPYASGAQTLVDAAALTFDGTNLIGTGYGRFDGGVGIGTAPSTTSGKIGQIAHNYTPTNTATSAYALTNNSIWNSSVGTNASIKAIAFNSLWTPADATGTATRTVTTLLGGQANLSVSSASLTTARNLTVTSASGFETLGSIVRDTGLGYSGVLTVTKLIAFHSRAFTVTGTPVIPDCYAFLDDGQTAGTNNWGIGINTPNNYINGSLRVGSAVAPTIALDVTGAGKFTTSVTAASYLLSDTADKNYTLSVYAAGTVYALTITPALLAFGTTSPSLTIDKAGTYRIFARAQVTRNNSTHIAAHTITFKLRRTNNTAADITNSSTTYADDPHNAANDTEHQDVLPEVIYTTANTNDVIELWGVVSAAGAGGTHDVDEANIVCQRLY